MRLDRSSNPVFNSSLFKDATAVGTGEGVMTIGGTVNKAILLFLITLFTSVYSWKMAMVGRAGALLWIGVIGGLIAGFLTVIKIDWAPITAPIYAAFEGLFLGAISAMFNAVYQGIVFKAVLLTFGVMFIVLLLYRLGILRATPGFVKWLVIATGGIAGYYIIAIILSFFHIDITTGALGGVGIGIQLFIVAIAALNFVLDFNTIEQGALQGAPKKLEWYAAFGLMVTLIWLYIEILRLLAILSSSRD